MNDRRLDDDSRFEVLSALVDGQAHPAEVVRACAAWRDDPQARHRWSSYQLIGDVMRSDELAAVRNSEQFLKSFHERLAQEPVVLAPAGLSARAGGGLVDVSVPQVAQNPLRRRMWAGPMAVAACFVMVVGALVVSQGEVPNGLPAASQMALTTPQGSGALPVAFDPGVSGNAFAADPSPAAASFGQSGAPGASAVQVAWHDPALEPLKPFEALNPLRGALHTPSFASGDEAGPAAPLHHVGLPTP